MQFCPQFLIMGCKLFGTPNMFVTILTTVIRGLCRRNIRTKGYSIWLVGKEKGL